MSYYPPVVVDPCVQSRGSHPPVQPLANPSISVVPSPMVLQQQIPQYMPITTTAPMPIPTRSPARPVAYAQQPLHTAQSLPLYAQQPQLAEYPSSSYTSGYSYSYGTHPSTHYDPGSGGGSYIFVQDRPSSPRRRHRHHRDRHGHRCFSHRRHHIHKNPKYDNHYLRS